MACDALTYAPNAKPLACPNRKQKHKMKSCATPLRTGSQPAPRKATLLCYVPILFDLLHL